MAFDVERRISKSAAALKREEDKESGGKDKTAPPGRYYVPIPRKIGGGSMPTFEQWQEEQQRKKGRK